MKIGIDISQTAYSGTGVAEYTQKLVENLSKIDNENEYILFFSSLRKKFPSASWRTNFPVFAKASAGRQFQIKKFLFPLRFLDFLWNRLHICPIECFIGEVDVFLSSDWVQPPAKKAKLVTVVHDLTPWKFPGTFHPRIVKVHKRRMRWVKKECDLIICDSESTKKDIMEILKIKKGRLKIIYPAL